MIKEMPLDIKTALIIRDHLQLAASEITELVQEQIPPELRDKPVETAVPDFDPEDLMKHDWKGKKLGQGQYEEGSLSWGWDYKDKFKPETIKALEQDSILAIDKYEFSLLEKIVQTKKVKGA